MDKKLCLAWQAHEYCYVTSSLHQLLGVGQGKYLYSNIGDLGENLTIAVLSLNRSQLTIRLMDSIEKHFSQFKGEFLVGDNGSCAEEKMKICDHFSEMSFRCRMVSFDKNYGVAGGRNRLFEEVKTEWIFSLDNDIYFINNPLEKIQQDIAQLGCHFLCMPLLNSNNQEVFIYGGHMFLDIEDDRIGIGGASAYTATHIDELGPHSPFLCTFLAGGCSIIKKKTFFQLNGYDEGMFVGFEDTEFSLRVFREGMKIGTCGIVSLIHDHVKPINDSDLHYEKQRFSNNKLYESALYFEKKHGYHIWSESTKNWIDQRKKDLGICENGSTPSLTTKSIYKNSRKPKVLLVVDVKNWAFDHIAKQVARYCSNSFDITIVYGTDVQEPWGFFLLGKEFDIIHFLWRGWPISEYASESSYNFARSLGLDPTSFFKDYIMDKNICTSVYDHFFLGDDFDITRSLFCSPRSPINAYSVSSNVLKSIYDADERILLKPNCVITDGVDLQLFQPQHLQRLEKKVGDTIVVGWAGNSKWGKEHGDVKGLHTLIQPVIHRLQAEGYPVVLKLCDRAEKWLPHEQMPNYYASIDVYLCMSETEGTPNPILECMACGVPFISTRVGIVPEVAGQLQSQFILAERTQQECYDKLLMLLQHPDLLVKLSKENLLSIQDWDWKIRSKKFIPMWKAVLES